MKDREMVIFAVIFIIGVIVLGMIAFEMNNATDALPEAKSTFNPSYGLFPAGYLTSEYEGVIISQSELEEQTTSVSLSLLPKGFEYVTRLYNESFDDYFIIISPISLPNLQVQTLYENGCILIHITTVSDALNRSSPSEDSELKAFVQDLANNVIGNGSPIFRIGNDYDFAYGYVGKRTPWGEQGMTIVFNDGTLISIRACLPEAWIRAISENLSIAPHR